MIALSRPQCRAGPAAAARADARRGGRAGLRRRHAAHLRSGLQAGARRPRRRDHGRHHPRPLRRRRGADPGRACRPTASCSSASCRQRRAPRRRRSPRWRRFARPWSSTRAARASARPSQRLRDGLGDREAAVAREISKKFEETVTGTPVRARRRAMPRRRPRARSSIVVAPPGEAEAAGEAEVDAALREAMAPALRLPRGGRGGRDARRAEAPGLRAGARSSNEPAAGGARRPAGGAARGLGSSSRAGRSSAGGCARRSARSTWSPAAAGSSPSSRSRRGRRGGGRPRARRIAASPGRGGGRSARPPLRAARRRHPDRRDLHRARAACPGTWPTSGTDDSAAPRPAKRAPMTLRVAVQMDPLEGINIEGNSTFAIMLGAQPRGHALFHYPAEDLSYRGGPAVDDGPAGDGAAGRRATISRSATTSSSISAATSTSC